MWVSLFAWEKGWQISRAFDDIRAHIRSGEGKPLASLFVHERFRNACQQGPHQHSLIVAGRHDKARVDAIVRLFGGLCYFVTLSEQYEGADFCDTLLYDAYRGKIDGMLLSNVQAELLQTEDVLTSGATVWGNLEATGRAFCEFLDQEVQAKLARDRSGSNAQGS
jgi:hypothetical protein